MKSYKKIFFALLLISSFSAFANAQGFSSFKVEGELFKASIKNTKSGPSKVEVVVGDDVDLKKVKSKYALLSSCQMDGKIKDDFTSPQKVEISKGAASKEWLIQVKKLQSAKLPLALNFAENNASIYTSSTTGWVTLGTDESKPSVVRMGNKDVSFIVAFDSEAKDVSYDLHVVGSKGTEFDGAFTVEVSADAKKWTPLATYNSKNTFSTDSNFTNELSSDVRFIKWTYKERDKQNVNLNNILVSPK